MFNLTDILTFLQQLAREAGQLMLDHLHQPVAVFSKDDGTLVTQVDLEVSQLVCQRVQGFDPSLSLMTEETSGHQVRGERGFIIDELDGTNSFLKRKSGFAFQAAYYENHDEIKVAVIFDPVRDLMVYAIKGQGVYLHALEKTLQLGRPPLRRWQYLRFAHHRQHMTATFDRIYSQMALRQEQIVATGCISNKVIAFALGEVDALIALNRYIPVWDWAPGKLIVEELGFSLTHLDGQTLHFQDQPGNTPFGYLVAPKYHIGRLIEELNWVHEKVSGIAHYRWAKTA